MLKPNLTLEKRSSFKIFHFKKIYRIYFIKFERKIYLGKVVKMESNSIMKFSRYREKNRKTG